MADRASKRAAIRPRSDSGSVSWASSPSSRYPPSTGTRRPSSISFRIVSTANSGMPADRSTMRRTKARGRPGTVSSSILPIASSESGSRCSAVKLRCPAPQVGLRSRSSGRARVTTRIRWPRLQVRIDSMKSISPMSAHWRSSNTSTTTPSSAIRSKSRRHAANIVSRSSALASSWPSRARRAGVIDRRSDSSGTYVSSVAMSF